MVPKKGTVGIRLVGTGSSKTMRHGGNDKANPGIVGKFLQGQGQTRFCDLARVVG